MYILIHAVTNSLHLLHTYLKAVLPKLLIFMDHFLLSWFEPFSQQADMHHTWKPWQATIKKDQ